MNITLEIINNILFGAISLLIVYRVFQLTISQEKLKRVIEDNLSINSDKVEKISKLTFAERIKYGVPGSVFGIYNYFFGIFTGKLEYTRRVDLSSELDQEIIKFISITIKRRRAKIIKVFDSYNL